MLINLNTEKWTVTDSPAVTLLHLILNHNILARISQQKFELLGAASDWVCLTGEVSNYSGDQSLNTSAYALLTVSSPATTCLEVCSTGLHRVFQVTLIGDRLYDAVGGCRIFYLSDPVVDPAKAFLVWDIID